MHTTQMCARFHIHTKGLFGNTDIYELKLIQLDLFEIEMF